VNDNFSFKAMNFFENRHFQRQGFAKETAIPFGMLLKENDFFNTVLKK